MLFFSVLAGAAAGAFAGSEGTWAFAARTRLPVSSIDVKSAIFSATVAPSALTCEILPEHLGWRGCGTLRNAFPDRMDERQGRRCDAPRCRLAWRMVRLVLLRPRNPENLGAIARVMKNFGLDDWAIAALGTHDFAAARRVAVHAEELLDRPRVVATLEEAVADCAWVVGTSSRRVRGKRRLSPAEVAREIAARAGAGRTAVVFGDERSGLTNAEIDRCHDLSAIPAADAQPSLNLAQAVAVYAWELREALLEAEAAPRPRRAPPGATDAELRRVEEALRAALRASGFLAGPERHAVRDLRATLGRAGLSRREAALWLAALRTLGRASPR